MKVKVGISNRHIHITRDDFVYLFGNEKLTKRNDLTQKGEYASNYVVKLTGPNGFIDNVRIVGPERSYTQVELSQTDCYKLGINCPVRMSGDLTDAALITISNNDKSIIRKCCIIPIRHIHISAYDRKKFNLVNDYYKVKVETDKPVIFDKVYIKEKDNYKFELHLDTDDANSCLLENGCFVDIME